MWEFLRGAALIAGTLSTGMMAGIFALYSHTIMTGLTRTDDRTFVAAFQAIDRAIMNAWFMVTFLGPLLFTGLAVLLHLGGDSGRVLPWVAAALALYLVAFAVTLGVNVPLNNGIKSAGDIDRMADVAAVRQRFNEARWVRWNHVRTLTSTAAFGCLAWALVVYGQTT